MPKRKLLIYDDDINFVRLLTFAMDETYETLWMLNYSEITEKIKSGGVDIMLINPSLGKDESFMLVREGKKWAVPSIIVTGESSEEIAIEALNSGASYFVKKPVSLEDIIKIINKIAGIVETEIDPVDRVRFFLLENYMNKININELCKTAHISRQKLFYSFKRRYNKSVLAFLKDLRMEKARELLILSDLTVTNISKAVGYKYIGYFCREFKRYYKKTPTQMRALKRKKK
jgi:AraC-like DNA-binding protein